LARALASSPDAIAHVDACVARFATQTRKTPVYEDAWLGYAMVRLLRPEADRRMSLVALDPLFVFDDARFSMHNLTLLVHWKNGKQYGRTFTARMRAAHDHATRHYCRRATPKMECGQWSHITKWGGAYPSPVRLSRPSCRNCNTEASPWTVCTLQPPMRSAPRGAPVWDLCPGFTTNTFGITADLFKRWTYANETFAPPCTEATCVV
jgi:hypothetical protein